MRRLALLAVVVLGACRSSSKDESPPPPTPAPPPALRSPGRGLALAITVESNQERRGSPPFHGPGGWSRHLDVSAGGGTFGVFVPDGDLTTMQLLPTTTDDGERVVAAFARAFDVPLPLVAPRHPLAPLDVRVVPRAEQRGWIETTWFCEDAAIAFNYNIYERRAELVELDRTHDEPWARCLAAALRDGQPSAPAE